MLLNIKYKFVTLWVAPFLVQCLKTELMKKIAFRFYTSDQILKME